MPKTSDSEFKVTFRGIRGSYPVSGKDYYKYGGSTTCYEVRIGECLIIVDAGTGIISLGQELGQEYCTSGKTLESRKPVEAIMLFTHAHFDHLQGFPFFAPMHMPDATFYIYGPDANNCSFNESIAMGVRPPLFPINLNEMPALKLFRSIYETESIYWSARKGIPLVVNNFREFKRKKMTAKENPIHISCLKGYAHPKDGVMIYRIDYNNKSLVIATDTEGYAYGDGKLIEFSQGADLLIHDAEYDEKAYVNGGKSKQGYGHSTVEMAVEVAQKAGAKQLALVHHDPTSSDGDIDTLEKTAKRLFAGAFAAKEHQEIVL